jgi:aryl-alcohol dehydrogenase-like predicted oxidoreductase
MLCNSSYSSCDVCLAIRFIKERQQKEQVEVAVATKFAALPWRFGRGSVLSALKKSLDRLGLSSVELYQLHWSAPLLSLIHLPVCKLSAFLTEVFLLSPFQAWDMGE